MLRETPRLDVLIIEGDLLIKTFPSQTEFAETDEWCIIGFCRVHSEKKTSFENTVCSVAAVFVN